MLDAPSALDDARASVRVLEPSPSPALLVLGGVLVSAGLLVLPWWFGAIGAFRYLFLLLTLSIGIVLYRAFPVLYVGFVWWLWFLAPFLRRVTDYYAGAYQAPNLILLAPYLVGGLSLFTLLRHRSRLLNRDYFPFVLVLAGLAYGYAIGILNHGVFAASYGLLQWIIPALFGFYVAVCWRDYPALRRCIQRTFLWGVALIGAYAVVQFFLMPPWDSFWMQNTPWRDGSLGSPKPFRVRPFSTLNSFYASATVIMAGLLLLFSQPTRKHLLAAVPGYAGFLVSIVRAAWGGWLIALMLMAVWIKGRMRTRLFGTLVLGALVILPLLSVPEIAHQVSNRFATFQNLETDVSLSVRLRQYQDATVRVLTNPIGNGIGLNAYQWDNGLLVIPHQLGWPGLFLFATGLVLLVRLVLRSRRRTQDAFAAISAAIFMATLAMLAFNNMFPDASGATLWCFAGLTIAGYHHARESEEEEVEPE